MKIITAFAVGLALAAALPAAPASALNARSFVSGHGNDANTCLFAAPCRTFAAAYAKTNAGGEISVLDPAGYGPLTITTALSIVNDGVGESSIVLIAAGNAITINAGATDAVSLRGLTLDGSGTASTNGIVFNSGASLTIVNCVIRHLTQAGIKFSPTAAGSLTVLNSLVGDNYNGIFVLPGGSAAVKAVFNRVQLTNNSNVGLLLEGDASTGSINATVSESLASGSGTGIMALTDSGKSPTTLMLVRSVAANNGIGVVAWGQGGTLRVDNSTVTANGIGWKAVFSGSVLSAGNNTIEGNTSDETAQPTYAQK